MRLASPLESADSGPLLFLTEHMGLLLPNLMVIGQPKLLLLCYLSLHFPLRCVSSLTLPSQGHLSAHEWMLLEHTMSPRASVVCPGTHLNPGSTT